jgi:hypothetical protein
LLWGGDLGNVRVFLSVGGGGRTKETFFSSTNTDKKLKSQDPRPKIFCGIILRKPGGTFESKTES